MTSAVEAVWAAVAVPLDAATAELARVRPAGRRPRRGHRGGVPRRRGRLRASAPPPTPTRWPSGSQCRAGPARDGRVDTSAAGPAARAGRGAHPRIAELDRVRQQARAPDRRPRGRRRAPPARPAGTRSRPGRTRRRGSARCRRSRRRSPSRRSRAWPRSPPAGQWSRLAAELDRCDGRAGRRRRSDRRTCARRRRPRSTSGMSCAGCCAPTRPRPPASARAEDPDLAASHDQAHGLLWTAPCDLAAAEAAVAAYQRAILATEGRR